jgi:hypothetical protein
MRKAERAEVEQAIRELMQGDDPPFDTAVARLCKLVGWRYPAGEIPLRGVSIEEAARGGDREFSVRPATEPVREESNAAR